MQKSEPEHKGQLPIQQRTPTHEARNLQQTHTRKSYFNHLCQQLQHLSVLSLLPYYPSSKLQSAQSVYVDGVLSILHFHCSTLASKHQLIAYCTHLHQGLHVISHVVGPVLLSTLACSVVALMHHAPLAKGCHTSLFCHLCESC